MLSLTAERVPAGERTAGLTWEDLGQGAPTIIALAQLASQTLVTGGARSHEGLSSEAKAILFAARERGVIAVKGSNKAFESVDRFLAVYVELDADTVMGFKSKKNPKVTVGFLDGLRQLCAGGLVIHQLYCEFSLSPAGFELAQSIQQVDVEEPLALGTKLGRHEW